MLYGMTDLPLDMGLWKRKRAEWVVFFCFYLFGRYFFLSPDFFFFFSFKTLFMLGYPVFTLNYFKLIYWAFTENDGFIYERWNWGIQKLGTVCQCGLCWCNWRYDGYVGFYLFCPFTPYFFKKLLFRFF